jgi:hypothetical protein
VLETLLEDASRARDRYLAAYLDARASNRNLEAELKQFRREQDIARCFAAGSASPSVGRLSESIRSGRQGPHGTLSRSEVDPTGDRRMLRSNGPSTELSGCAVTQHRQSVDLCDGVEGRPGIGDPKTLLEGLDHNAGDICDVLGNGSCGEPDPETDEDGYPIGLPTAEKLVYAGTATHQTDDESSTDTSFQRALIVHDVTDTVITSEKKQQPEHAVAQPIMHVEAHKKLAQQIAYCLTQLIDKMKLVCGMITNVSGSESFNDGPSRD